MASTFSTNLKIELQTTGENSGTWGTITNTNLGTALEQAIVGYGNPSYASDANLTLTYTDTNAAQTARALVLNVTSAVSLTGTRELVVPTIQKQYIVQNNTTGSQSITVKTSGGTGVTVPNGRKAHLYVNGTDVIYMDDYVDINGGAIDGTPIGANSASTGAFTTLAASGNVTLSGGTANGVLYLNGSKVATSGSALVFDGTNLGVGTASPASKLTVSGDVQILSTNYLNFTNTAQQTYIRAPASNTIAFGTSSTEQMRLDSSGRLLVGDTIPRTVLNKAIELSSAGTSANQCSIFVNQYVAAGNAANTGYLTFQRSGSGTLGTNSIVASGDRLGMVRFSGANGTDYSAAAEIYAEVDGTPGASSDMPGRIIFATTADGAGTTTERMRLDSSGHLGLGVTPNSTWDSGRRVFQIGGNGALWGQSSGSGFLFLSNNLYYDGTNFRYLNTAASAYYTIASDSSHRWYQAVSGTAGNVITVGDPKMILDLSGNLGIGTASPSYKLDVRGSGNIVSWSDGTTTGVLYSTGGYFGLTNSAQTNGFFVNPSGSFCTIATNGSEKLRIDSSGNLGLGVTPSASSVKTFEIASAGNTLSGLGGGDIALMSNAYYNSGFKYAGSNLASSYRQQDGVHKWNIAASGTAGNAISFTQAMTLTAAGDLLVGTTVGLGRLATSGTGDQSIWFTHNDNTPGRTVTLRLGNSDSTYKNASAYVQAIQGSGIDFYSLVFGTTNGSTTATERGRFTSGGDFLVGKQAVDSSVAGCEVQSTGQYVGVRNGLLALFNRLTTDGDLISFRQDGTEEGSISVSGNTVSYNAFAGSHWSQLQDGSKPDILRGTVMESINELCVWPDETNERLPKSKVSDTAGSKKVYGVFMAWDNDWATTNDMYITAVGAFICRVNGSVTVQEGDLLESNGDGTARVQADDIIRSSTIGKVTSTVKTHEYDDGSYCVPTVLYCG